MEQFCSISPGKMRSRILWWNTITTFYVTANLDLQEKTIKANNRTGGWKGMMGTKSPTEFSRCKLI